MARSGRYLPTLRVFNVTMGRAVVRIAVGSPFGGQLTVTLQRPQIKPGPFFIF